MIKRYEYIFEAVNNCKPKTIIDIGVWNAVNSCQIIETASIYNKVEYYGFDLWEDLDSDKFIDEYMYPKKKSSYEEALKRIKHLNTTRDFSFSLFRGDTKINLKKENFPLPSVDFVFIDGGHSLDTIESDWNNIKWRLHKDSVVIFDDYWHNRNDAGCKNLIDRLIKEDLYNISISVLNTFKLYDISIVELKIRE